MKVIRAVALFHNKAVDLNLLPWDDVDNFVEISSLEIAEEKTVISSSSSLFFR